MWPCADGSHTRAGPQFLDQTSPWPPALASILHWGVIGSSWCCGGTAWAVVRGCVAADWVSDPLVGGRPMASARTHDAPHISVMTVIDHPHRRWSSYIDAQHYRLRGSKLQKTHSKAPTAHLATPHAHPSSIGVSHDHAQHVGEGGEGRTRIHCVSTATNHDQGPPCATRCPEIAPRPLLGVIGSIQCGGGSHGPWYVAVLQHHCGECPGSIDAPRTTHCPTTYQTSL
jgi:hypothetical protein